MAKPVETLKNLILRRNPGNLTPSGQNTTNKADSKLDDTIKKLDALNGSVSELVEQLKKSFESKDKSNKKITGESSSINEESLKNSIQPMQDVLVGVLGAFTGSQNLNNKIKDSSLKASNNTAVINWWKKLYTTDPTNFVISQSKDGNSGSKVAGNIDINIKGNQKLLEELNKVFANKFSTQDNKKIKQIDDFIIGLGNIVDDLSKINDPSNSLNNLDQFISGLITQFNNIDNIVVPSTTAKDSKFKQINKFVEAFNSIITNLNNIKYPASGLGVIDNFISNKDKGLQILIDKINRINIPSPTGEKSKIKEIKDFLGKNGITGIIRDLPSVNSENINKKIQEIANVFGGPNSDKGLRQLFENCNNVANVADQKDLTQITSFIAALAQIGNWGGNVENSHKQAIKNLKLMRDITATANLGTKLGLNNRGIIYKIIRNAEDLNTSLKQKDIKKGIDKLNEFFNTLGDIGSNIDVKRFKELTKYCKMFDEYFDVGGPLDSMIANYKLFNDRVSQNNTYTGVVNTARIVRAPFEAIKPLFDIDKSNYTKMMSVTPVLWTMANLFSINGKSAFLFKLLDNFKTFHEQTDKIPTNVDSLKTAITKPFEVMEALKGNIKGLSFDIVSSIMPYVYAYGEGRFGILRKLLDNFTQFGEQAKAVNQSRINTSILTALEKPMEDIRLIAMVYDKKDFDNLIALLNGFQPLKKAMDYINTEFASLGDSPLSEVNKGIDGISTIVNAMDSNIDNKKATTATATSKLCVDMLNSIMSISIEAGKLNPIIGLAIASLEKIYTKEKNKKTFVEILKDVVSSFTTRFGNRSIENTNKNLVQTEELIGHLNRILKVAAVCGVLATPAIKALDAMDSISDRLVTIIDKFKAIDGTDKAIENAKQFTILIGITTAILLVGCVAGLYIITNFMALMSFTVALSSFIFLTLEAYKIGSRSIDDAGIVAEKFAELVVVSAVVLLIGGLIMTANPAIIVGSLAFAVTLGAFMFLVLTAYSFGTKKLNDTMKSAHKFMDLMVVCAGTMMIGAVFMTTGLGGQALLFGLMLGAYMVLMAGVYRLVALVAGKETLHEMEQFAILIGVSTLTLMIGAVFMMSNLWVEALKFAGVLAVFIGGIGLAYALITRLGGKNAIQSMKEFSWMIAISAATLVVGGLVMMIPGMPDAIMSFAITLGGFILAISLGLGIAGKLMGSKGMVTMLGIALVTLVAGGILLYAGKMYLDNPGLQDAVESFRTTTLSLILGMGVICFALGTFKKQVAIGIACVGGIILLVYLIGKAMNSVVSVLDTIGGRWDELDMMLVRTAIIFGSVIAVVGAIAAATAFPVIGEGVIAALAAAEGIVLGLVGIVYGIGKAMKAIAEAANAFADMKPVDFDFVSESMSQMSKIGLKMGWWFNPLVGAAVTTAVPTVLMLSTALGKIADVTQQMANMTMPMYDENGKLVGRKTLTSDDLAKSSENIKTVITNLAGAVQEVYNGDKKIFGTAFNSIFHVDTPFTRVVKSCMSMGNMISTIAEGVKEMASLSVPVYKNGKIVGKRQLNDNDFKLAADNISKIITTIGGAIIGLYNCKVEGADSEVVKEMFATEGLTGWLGTGKATTNTIFGRIVVSFTAMGKMIGEIGKGVKEMADLKIPIYTGTKITGYRTLGDKDFDTAAENIKKIVVCLATAMGQAYHNNEVLFTDPSSWYVPGNKSPLAMMIKSFSGIGKTIGEMVTAIKAVSDLRIQKYDAAGRPIKGQFISIQDEINGIFTPDGKEVSPESKLYKNLRNIATLFPYTLNDIYKNNKEAFDDNNEGIEAVKNSVKGVKTMVDTVLSTISSIKKSGVDDKSLSTVKANLVGIMSIIPESISAAYYKNPGVTPDIYEAMKKEQDSMVTNLKNRTQIFADSIQYVFKGYQEIQKSGVKFNERYNEEHTQILKDNLKAVVGLLPNAFRDLTIDSKIEFFNDDFKNKITGFLQYYRNLRDTLSEEVKFDRTQTNSLVSALHDVNVELYTLQSDKVDKFGSEANSLKYFTNSINSLDSTKTSKMIELISTINKMAENIHGLDKFTKTLANDLAVVLSHLTEQLKQSATTIDKAEKIQKLRHEKIEQSIKKVNTMLNNPVQVIVSQVDENANDQEPDSGNDTGNSFKDSGTKGSSSIPEFNKGVGSDKSMAEQSLELFKANLQKLIGVKNNNQGSNSSGKPAGRGSSKK